MNNNLDLTVSRTLKAPPNVVWRAWTEPEHFVKWWAPSPVVTISNKHDFFSGGGFDTDMRLEDIGPDRLQCKLPDQCVVKSNSPSKFAELG